MIATQTPAENLQVGDVIIEGDYYQYVVLVERIKHTSGQHLIQVQTDEQWRVYAFRQPVYVLRRSDL